MVVFTTSNKAKKTSYKCDVTIQNNDGTDYSSYTIVVNLPTGVTITKAKHYDITGDTPPSITLTPQKISTFANGSSISLKIKGEGLGLDPSNFSFNGQSGGGGGGGGGGGNLPIILPMVGQSIDDVTKAGIQFQWSYNQQVGYDKTHPNPKYFSIIPEGLSVSIFVGDLPFQKGSNTSPRSELRFPSNLLNDTKYTIQFDQFLTLAPTFDYCFLQVFAGSNPGLIIRWRKGNYQILNDDGGKDKAEILDKSGLKPSDLVGKWHNWKLDFCMSSSNGYANLSLDGSPIIQSGAVQTISSKGPSYCKAGIYSSMMTPSNDVAVYIRNFSINSST